ncbi:MAG: SagB/ThcOx family dehydrogenase [Bacteroidales bacterium]|nr:SagB/ThcOx family dehydrogenase [Bacteroidales bacterium]
MVPIQLPDAQRSGGMPLRDALRTRRSMRTFSQRRFDLGSPTDLQLLSDLLWAAFGNISPKRRSAPSSHNRQETDLYVLLPEGAYRYEPSENRLAPVTDRDLRAASGAQDYVGTAAVEIAFVADTAKITGKSPRGVVETIYVDTGFISQNIYLFCTSEGLATVVRAMVPKESLAQALGLSPTQEITLVQTVGWKSGE